MEMLAVCFDRLESHLFLEVGHEIHGESFVIIITIIIIIIISHASIGADIKKKKRKESKQE